jgi:hypothetical protein
MEDGEYNELLAVPLTIKSNKTGRLYEHRISKRFVIT